MRSRARLPHDPLADLDAPQLAALDEARLSLLARFGPHYRSLCRMGDGARHSPRLIDALVQKGLLAPVDAQSVQITARGRKLAGDARRRAARCAQLKTLTSRGEH